LSLDDSPPQEAPGSLSDDVVAILGEKADSKISWGPNVHPDLVPRWKALLASGLSEDEKKLLIQKYPPPENLQHMGAPILNPVVLKAISTSNAQRDQRMASSQSQMAATLSALGRLLTLILAEEGGGNRQHISLLNDASRLLMDSFHQQTLARRGLIAVNLSKEFQEINNNIPLDPFLFGENLEERLKNTKSLEDSGKTLKPKISKTPYKGTAGALNYKAPPRQHQGTRREGSKFHQSSIRQFKQIPNNRQFYTNHNQSQGQRKKTFRR